jgi:hypothetical protein
MGFQGLMPGRGLAIPTLMRRLRSGIIRALLCSLLCAFTPKEGDLIELQGAFNGRETASFERADRDNIRVELPPHTVGRIDRLKRFESGNYGVLVTVANGAAGGKQLWVHYDPRQRKIDLCKRGYVSSTADSCVETRKIADARGIRTREPVTALEPAPGSPRAAQATAGDVRKITAQLGRVGVALDPPASTECGVAPAEIPRAPAASCLEVPAWSSKPDFGQRGESDETQREFIRWMIPLAVRAQALTGFPAPVIIAQAALESGYGTSAGYQERNSLFGHSCDTYGETRTVDATIDGNRFLARASCTARRPHEERGYYLVFKRPEDSMLLYLENLLQSPGVASEYAGLRAAMARRLPGKPASTEEIVQGLKEYAGDDQYRSKLRKIIRDYDLDRLRDLRICGE